MLLADTHLLGPIKGHWLDKLKREWQMNRAFQAAVTIHSPDIIFILGKHNLILNRACSKFETL